MNRHQQIERGHEARQDQREERTLAPDRRPVRHRGRFCRPWVALATHSRRRPCPVFWSVHGHVFDGRLYLIKSGQLRRCGFAHKLMFQIGRCASRLETCQPGGRPKGDAAHGACCCLAGNGRQWQVFAGREPWRARPQPVPSRASRSRFSRISSTATNYFSMTCVVCFHRKSFVPGHKNRCVGSPHAAPDSRNSAKFARSACGCEADSVWALASIVQLSTAAASMHCRARKCGLANSLAAFVSRRAEFPWSRSRAPL